MNVLEFWFPDDGYQDFWFDKSIDEYINKKYKIYLSYYESFEINPQILTDEEILEVIIILDQFSRNIYRNSIYNKKNDEKALNLSIFFLKKRNWIDKKLNHLIFYMMPLRHNESFENYNLLFKILNEINISKLNDKESDLLQRFKKVSNFKYKKYLNISI